MNKKGLKTVIISAIALVFLIYLFFPDAPTKCDFGITYINYESLSPYEVESLEKLFTDKYRKVTGNENGEIGLASVALVSGNNAEKDSALAQMLYGNGNIYIAPFSLIWELLPDEDLFSMMPEDILCDVITHEGKNVAVSIGNIEKLEFMEDEENLCIFVRSAVARDEKLSKYYEKNQTVAFDIIRELK